MKRIIDLSKHFYNFNMKNNETYIETFPSFNYNLIINSYCNFENKIKYKKSQQNSYNFLYMNKLFETSTCEGQLNNFNILLIIIINLLKK